MSDGNTNNTVFIQKLFTSRDNFTQGNVQEATANALAFVGQDDRLWWEPTTNRFYFSDGNTPGGIPVGGGNAGNGNPGGPTNSLQFNAGNDIFGGSANVTISGNGINVLGNINSAYFIGSGNNLSNIQGSNVSGEVANANYATFSGTAYSVSGANVSGEVANANYATLSGTAYSVAVANVSGIGNIAVINLDGSSSNVLYGNGVFAPDNVSGEVANANYATFAGTAYAVAGANVSGEVANANYASFAGTAYAVAGANVSGEVANANYASFSNTSYSVAGANVSGEVANANYAAFSNTAYSVNVANVSGIGNIATVNLDSSTSNVLYGNGVFAPASGDIANANYANFAGTAYAVSGANVSGEVANANYATFAGTAYAVSGANVSGEVANANYATYSGTQNKILNGTSFANINASNGNLEISINTNAWNFDTTGNLTFPQGSIINEVDPFLTLSGAGSTEVNQTYSLVGGQYVGDTYPTYVIIDRGAYWDVFDTSPTFSYNYYKSFDLITWTKPGAYEGQDPPPIGVLSGPAFDLTINGNIWAFGSDGNTSFPAIGAANLGNSVTANFFIGSGNNLSNIQGANVSGEVANANYATYAGTLLTNAQPNITSVGTLSSLSVTGNITGGNLSTAGTITANGGSYGEVVATQFASVWGSGAGPNPYSIMQVRSSDGVSGLGMQAFTGSGTLYGNTNINFGLATIRDKDVPSNLVIKANIDSTGLNVTGIANISGNITGANLITGGIVSATGNIIASNVIANSTVFAVTANVSGNTNANIVNANYFYGDGSNISNLTLTGYAAGNTTEIQFNATGNFSASPNLTFNASTNLLTVIGNIAATSANIGNLVISGQTVAGIISTQDVNIETLNGSANINLLGGFNVHSGNLAVPPDFSVDATGRVTILVPVPEQYLGSVNIIGSPDGTEVPPQNYGVLLQQTGQQSTPSRIYNDGVANYAAYVGRRYNGTAAAPTAITGNQIISRVSATPYVGDTVTGWPTISTARIDFLSTESQSAANNGSKIQLWTTPQGTDVANIALVADFGLGGITMTGNVLPFVNDTYSLGNSTLRWIGGHFGNAGIFIQDNTTGDDGQIALDNNKLTFSNIDSLQVGNLQFTSTGIITVTDPAQDVLIGNPGDTGTTVIRNAGLEFPSGNIQTDAGIPTNQKGAALGVVPLNGATKIDSIYLPAGGLSYQGIWNASTNTPTLADGVGNVGDQWIVGTAGTANLGSGSITFALGDFAVYNSSNVWQDVPVGGTGVTSWGVTGNYRTGIVTLESSDITTALSANAIVNSKLQNSNVIVTSGAGLAGGGTINLGGNITLTANVRDITAGTGVTVTPSTGNYTIAIGQPVATTSSVQFGNVTVSSTIQATGNITGGNLSTANTVSVGGNIIGNNITANTLITANNITANGNINLTASGNVSLGSNANIHITGGNPGETLVTNGAGNLRWATPLGANTIIQSGDNTTVNVDFTYESLHLVYIPTGPVTITLSNYASGHTARVLVRYASPYTLNTGIANVQQSTDGTIIIPTTGSGGHKISGQQTVQLVYTCFDSTAANCYVATTFL